MILKILTYIARNALPRKVRSSLFLSAPSLFRDAVYALFKHRRIMCKKALLSYYLCVVKDDLAKALFG